MSLLSKKEFAALCQTTTAIITTNIHRGKIIYLNNKKIDSEDPLNKAFYDRYVGNFDSSRDPEPVNAKSEILVAPKPSALSKSAVDWSIRKKKADTLLQERKAEKEKITLQKLAGLLIPVDLVFKILSVHNRDIFIAFQNDLENISSIYCDVLAGGDRKKLGEINTKLGDRLFELISRAKEVSSKSIEIGVENYRETRSRGEHK